MDVMEDLSSYDKIREDTRLFYSTIRPTYSPAFDEMVYFTAEGFNHLIYKGSHTERDRSSQIMRFKLLARATKLIGYSTTYQEYEETLKEFQIKSHKRRVTKIKPVRYWGVIAIFEGRKIKVILRKIGDDGRLHFWSIVPAWMTNKYRDIKFFSTMKGNPEED